MLVGVYRRFGQNLSLTPSEPLEIGTYRLSRNVSKLPIYVTSNPKKAKASSRSLLQGLLCVLCVLYSSAQKRINTCHTKDSFRVQIIQTTLVLKLQNVNK
jgi:hypothetical protein